jgi:SPX domain protein involved in polyphosphate accumulation
MVEFGKQLQLLQQSAQDQAWKEYYIDYSLLKFLIKKAKKNNHNKKPTTASTTATTTTTKIKKEENENDISQKKRHKKSTSSLGNLLELMQSSSTTTDGVTVFDLSEEDPLVDQHQQQQQHALNASSHKRTNSGSLIAVSPFLNASSSRKFQHMVQDGYVKALEFRQVLDQEIEKLVLFCLAQEGHLAQQLYQLSKQRLQLKDNVYQAILMTQQQQQQNDSTTPMVMMDATIVTHRRLEESYNTLATLTTHYRNMASQLLQLLEFMDVNVVALRKILKKHDKNFPHFKLSATYLRERLTLLPTSPQEDDDNNIIMMPVGHYHLQQIYHFGGLSSLLLALKSAFDDLHALEWNLLAVQHYQQQSHHQQQPQSQPHLQCCYRR